MNKKLIACVLATFLLTGALTGGTMIQDFESGQLGADWSGDTSFLPVTSTNPYEGTYSIEKTNDDSGQATRNLPDAPYSSFSYAFYWDNPSSDSQRPSMSIRATNNDLMTTFAMDDGSLVGQDAIMYYDGTAWQDTGIRQPDGIWTIWSYESINYTSNTLDFVVYYGSNTTVYNRSDDIPFRSSASGMNEFVLTFTYQEWYLDNIKVNASAVTAPEPERSLEIDINSWMPRDSTQSYEVILNETNTTSGETNLTDVTADANVTIYNITNTTGFSEPIATVNNSTDEIESYNETGVVAVNATYDGNELDNATNLTVGPRNLDNIGIMPPEQWPCSFLVCDESPDGGDNPHNIGSSMQWTLFIIIVMAVGSRMFENPWAGVGGGMLTSILLWILEFVVLGVVLGTVFSGILVGIIMIRSSMGRGVARDDEFSGTAGSRFRR